MNGTPTPRWVLAYRGALVGLVVAAFAIPLALAAVPFIEFFNGMAAQPKGKAQMTYGRRFGEERPVDRDPVSGTVPRGYAAYPLDHLGNTVEDAKKAGGLLKNPAAITMENVQRGRKIFTIFCAACHGETGEGNGPVVGPGRFPAPTSLHTQEARDLPDGAIFHIITKGRLKMPSYAGQVAPEDRWKVVLYVRALQRAMNPKPGDFNP